jgi:hypothetical protein
VGTRKVEIDSLRFQLSLVPFHLFFSALTVYAGWRSAHTTGLVIVLVLWPLFTVCVVV